MALRDSPHGYWSSPRSFIFAAGAATIGLGNLWRMPSLMGEYGGSAFLIAYLLSLAFVVLPLLVAEFMIGRYARQDVVAGLQLLTAEGRAPKFWGLLGWLPLIGAVLVLSYYSVIAGWSMGYFFRAAGGVFAGADSAKVTETLRGLVGDSERSLAWHTMFMVCVTICLSHGLRRGIEAITVPMLPLLLIELLIVLGMGLVWGEPRQALSYLFTPDFSKLGWRGVIEALNQAFFSLSLGFGVMATFGVFLPRNVWLVASGLGVIGIDLLFALLGGLAIFTLTFSANVPPSSGVRLVFEALPLATAQLAAGPSILVLFYLVLVSIAAMGAIGLMEPIVQWMMRQWAIPRVFAVTSTGLLIWFLGLGTLLSFSVTADFRFLGRNYFEWLDLLTAKILVPTVGLLTCIFVGRILPLSLVRDAWADEPVWAFKAWRWCLIYPARIGLIVVLFYASGLLDRLVQFFTSGAAAVAP